MLTLRVDSSLIPGVNAPISLDALLSAVEPVLGEAGRIVTALRINGVDHPAFREAELVAQTLTAGEQVEIDTTAVGTMAGFALEDALRYLPQVASSAQVMADDLRSEPAAVRPALGNLAENLALLTALVHTADMWARQAGLAATDWLGDDVVAVEQAVTRLEQAAGAEEWLAAAAALQHDLPTALTAWQVRLTAGRAAVLALNAAPTA